MVKPSLSPSSHRRLGAVTAVTIRQILTWLIAGILLLYGASIWMFHGQMSSGHTDPASTLNKSPIQPRKTRLSSLSFSESHPHFPHEPFPRPPLSEIVQGYNITGDPSWLLNLAIIGFPKTGTSTLMKYLHMSPQIHVFDEERCEMGYNQHALLMERLYRDIPEGDFIRGIKCPRDLENHLALQNYQNNFPKTDFMVGLRHPVEWFESFYNFRVNNFFVMPPADKLLGRCTRHHQGLCTFRGNFHLHLANLGKTHIATDKREQQLVPQEYRHLIKPIPLQGRIFLWDISQLKAETSEEGRQRSAQFREDLRHFLYLDNPLPEMIHVKPGFDHVNKTIQQHISSQKIDICEERYEQVRSILVQQGKLASRWIREYFLEADGVVVSEKEHFTSVILKSWEHDPCADRMGAIGE